MRTRPCLSREVCEVAVAAGLAHADDHGWQVTVVIVDDGGFPVHLSRMDGASPASVETAVQKARSAALTGVDSKLLEDMIAKRPGVATMGRVAVEGGVAVIWEKQRVGGVGVSGVQSHEDAVIATVVRDRLLAIEASRL